MSAKIAVLMTCFNRRETTLVALGRLVSQANDLQLDIVLVDDASTDGTAEAVRSEFPQVKVVQTSGDYYWAASMALAESEASKLHNELVLWLNDDVVLDDDALARMMQVHERHPAAIVVGAVRERGTGEVSYGGRRRVGRHPQKMVKIGSAKSVVEVGAFNGNCVLIPAVASRTVGPIDGNFSHAYADDDYSLRAFAAGVKMVQVPGTVGTCALNVNSTQPASTVRGRWKQLQSPKALPLKSQVRYLRRHAGPEWPIYLMITYAKRLFNAN